MKHPDKTYSEYFTPLVRILRTARLLTSDCPSGYFGLPVRILLTLLLLTASVSGTWGQDFSGIYYFINCGSGKTTPNDPKIEDITNTDDYFYLVPADDPKQDNKRDAYYSEGDTDGDSNKPYLTTYRTMKDAAVIPEGVTNRLHNSVWILQAVTNEPGFYYIIHAATGKYVVYEPPYSTKNNRKSVHLLATDSPEDNAKFAITTADPTRSDYFNFRVKELQSGNRFLNPTNANYNFYYSSDSYKDGNVVDYLRGLVGLYKNKNNDNANDASASDWVPVATLLDAPLISDVDKSTNTFTITDANSLPSGYTIRYTTDGTLPTATTGTIYTDPVTVTGNWTVKAVVVRYGMVLTGVQTKSVEPAQCKTPVITYSTGTGKVSISSETPNATIYYTLDGETPTTPYNAPFDVADQQTVRAIATNIESSFIDSEIASSKLVLNPTITLEATEYTYSGSAIMPAVSSVMDGDDAIPASEYEISYSDNNINVGTATINIVDKAGGAYIVYGSKNFTIVPAEVTLTANSGTETYDGTEKTVTGFTSSVDGLTFEGVSASGSGTNTGSYDVTFTGVTINTTKDTSGNYIVTDTTNGTLTINKKPLTITANPKTIIYGNEPTNDGVAYSGFALGEDESVLSGTLAYAYDYAQFDDAGDYHITPSGLTGANYDISFVPGTLTVSPKEVGLTWSEPTSFTYDGSSHGLTATATGLVNSDVIAVTVTGEQTNAGNHTATASSLTGEKAGNYKLPTENTHAFTITPVGLTVTAEDHSITYGAAPAGNGVTYEGFVGEDDESKLSGTLGYDYSYTQFGDVGDTYTITPKGLTSTNYDIAFVAGTLTVNQKEVGLSWGETTTFEYNGSPQAPTATATGLVNSDVVTITVTGAQTNAGNHTATASELTGDKAGNYKLPESNTQSFTISPKSIGDGTLASGYILDFGESNTILLMDDDIGSVLAMGTDYSVSEDSDDSPKYSLRTVTGQNNYTGSFIVRNVVISFTTDTEQEDWSATFAAEDTYEFDIEPGLALPEGVSAFIISGIQGDWAIPEPLNYIPKGVPVLLVAHKQINGFVPTIAGSGNVTQDQKDRNMLEEVTEATADYDADTESAPFATKQIYLLYKNEFVFNKAGNLKKGKVYLNPNHTAPSPEPAPARLLIAWNYATGIEDGRWKMEDGRSERWYTLDGRCLSGKPNIKGLYIVNGKKVVIK